LTDGDDLEISKILQAKKKIYNSDIDERLSEEMKFMIKSVNGKTDREYINAFIDRMRSKDSRAFRKYVNENQPGVDFEQEVTCEKCGELDHHRFSLGAEFFYPEL
jgi:hypothetical protein